MIRSYRKPLYAQESGINIEDDSSRFMLAAKAASPDTLFYSAYRASTMFWNKHLPSETDKTLTKEEANAKYGIQGVLEFTEDVLEDNAKIKYAREQKKAIIAGELAVKQEKHSYISNLGVSLLGSMAAIALDPIELPMSFFPVVGTGGKAATVGAKSTATFKIFSKQRTAFSNLVTKGIINETKIAEVVGGNKTLARFAEGAIEGSVGNAIVEPFLIVAANYEDREYTTAESLMNIAAGAALGGLVRGGMEAISKATKIVDKSSIGTRELAGDVAIAKYITDGETDAAGKIYAMDEGVIRQQLEEQGIEATPERIEQQQNLILEDIRKEELAKNDTDAIFEKAKEDLELKRQEFEAEQKAELTKADEADLQAPLDEELGQLDNFSIYENENLDSAIEELSSTVGDKKDRVTINFTDGTSVKKGRIAAQKYLGSLDEKTRPLVESVEFPKPKSDLETLAVPSFNTKQLNKLDPVLKQELDFSVAQRKETMATLKKIADSDPVFAKEIGKFVDELKSVEGRQQYLKDVIECVISS